MNFLDSLILKPGYLYAYLSSKYGYSLLTQGTFGAVIQHIEPNNVAGIPIPVFPDDFQAKVDDLIQESSRLREESADLLEKAKKTLKSEANLPDLTVVDYNYFGSSYVGREVSTFVVNRNKMTPITINAFNYSERQNNTERKIKCKVLALRDVLKGGNFFTTGSFPRKEVEKQYGIKLINQSDIFDCLIKGKYISKRGIKTTNLVSYGEILIAGVGTLGENETFGRVVFANEDIEEQLISGEFLRMKTNEMVPNGYLFAWLSTDYGFRMIRSTQTGTKLCRPIQKMLLNKPVPIISKQKMQEIDTMVKDAHHKYYLANNNELSAISLVEKAIESWGK